MSTKIEPANSSIQTCYMCSERATSTEHVPPKCLFPEKKDLPNGSDYRRNLLTVPACDAHNLMKSQDDEYLLFVIASYFQNNEAGQLHLSTKVIRALTHRPSKQLFFANYRLAFVGGEETLAYQIDFIRFKKAVDAICRAIYYHDCHEQFALPLSIQSPALLVVEGNDSQRLNGISQELASRSTAFLASQAKKGDNPDIFYYQSYYNIEEKQFITRMVFYDGFEVVALVP